MPLTYVQACRLYFNAQYRTRAWPWDKLTMIMNYIYYIGGSFDIYIKCIKKKTDRQTATNPEIGRVERKDKLRLSVRSSNTFW